ncbi:hypothetical protein CCAL9344_08805 [Campylobacter sp. RM9344]|uniref:Uncharacterized protein n=1 Tax=Campylobacter californiensis TaxID=1032243 RepID=A0AAW3ZXZ1_9BACT|nr:MULTISPECIES: hypothetical protein [unclassified Campylobacter]MBE2984040.1 hypothetical protein [Campylobacter sp. RM6883]MBE2987085.1 hypothetical protein [Campylobacter sp. RM12919]MBE2988361.1 hypothetical protein [Campylobacter sp. RM12920]MBE2995465.1 hypothetical protein [Campylobacter sp. RM6913]MBE3030279.1 hypothetical protein [Campylobacter sp. RM9344]
MSVTPLGNVNFINQNAPVASFVSANQQARFDMQSALASTVLDDDANEVAEVRPTEESYKIDPEHEHERQKGEEQNAQSEPGKPFVKDDDDKEEQKPLEGEPGHRLNIQI